MPMSWVVTSLPACASSTKSCQRHQARFRAGFFTCCVRSRAGTNRSPAHIAAVRNASARWGGAYPSVAPCLRGIGMPRSFSISRPRFILPQDRSRVTRSSKMKPKKSPPRKASRMTVPERTLQTHADSSYKRQGVRAMPDVPPGRPIWHGWRRTSLTFLLQAEQQRTRVHAVGSVAIRLAPCRRFCHTRDGPAASRRSGVSPTWRWSNVMPWQRQRPSSR